MNRSNILLVALCCSLAAISIQAAWYSPIVRFAQNFTQTVRAQVLKHKKVSLAVAIAGIGYYGFTKLRNALHNAEIRRQAERIIDEGGILRGFLPNVSRIAYSMAINGEDWRRGQPVFFQDGVIDLPEEQRQQGIVGNFNAANCTFNFQGTTLGTPWTMQLQPRVVNGVGEVRRILVIGEGRAEEATYSGGLRWRSGTFGQGYVPTRVRTLPAAQH